MSGRKQATRIVSALVALLVAVVISLASGGDGGGADRSQGASQQASPSITDVRDETRPNPPSDEGIREDGKYGSKDELAAYIHEFGHLPSNFVSKGKAREAGWNSARGNLDEVCPGMSIGGDRYHNDDGQLPDKRGRSWTECDVNYSGGFRGGERIVFSNDGLVYYTGDHYRSFERLY